MRSPCGAEGHVSAEAFAGDRHAVIGVQVDLFIFDVPPQPFREQFVAPRPFSVDADPDPDILQCLDEVNAIKRAASNRDRSKPTGHRDVGDVDGPDLIGARHCRQCDFRLEGPAVVPSRSSCHLRSYLPPTLPDRKQKIRLTQLF